MVKIEMPAKYWKALHRALDTAAALYALKFDKAFESIVAHSYRDQFEPGDVAALSENVHYAIFGDAKVKPDGIAKTIKEYKKKFMAKDGEYDLSDDDFYVINRALDLTIRIALGQWNEFGWAYSGYSVNGERFMVGCFDELTNSKLANIRNRMIPLFPMNNIHGANASFGIYSPSLANEIGYMYGIYKAINFATKGNPHDEEIVKNSDKPVLIKFPYVKSFVVKNMDQVKQELADCMIPDYISEHKSYVEEEDGTIYVYYRHGMAIRVDPGTKIAICHNSWPEIERDGKVYSYRSEKNYFG